MSSFIRDVYVVLTEFGLDPRRFVRSVRGLPQYIKNYISLQRQIGRDNGFGLRGIRPCLGDRFSQSGAAKGHYFHQDLLVARRINENNPNVHVDVGSRIDGFVAHVASFREINVFDIRPLRLNIQNIKSSQVDIMDDLPEHLEECCDSLSCLHALEHFGLGRYGDPIDYRGHLKGFHNLYRLLRQNGRLYLSVPIGPQRIEFDAHRVFSLEYLLDLFEGRYQLESFSYVDDDGDMHESEELNKEDIACNFGCSYGCGIFELVKL